MDQLVQCPVCTLFLHNGMSLETHLDTHPKDQVIKALCSLSSNRSNYGSRASTPMHSERSYRSRSRTPAIEDPGRWNNSNLGIDSERSWRSTRTPKTSTVTRSTTPSEFRSEGHVYQHNRANDNSSVCSSSFTARSDKASQQFSHDMSVSSYDNAYIYGHEQKEEKETKYSKSPDYQPLHNNPSATVYIHNAKNLPQSTSKTSFIPPTVPKRNNELLNMMSINNKHNFIKILPKTNQVALVKTNIGSMQYVSPGVMVPASPNYVPKNPQNQLIMGSNLQQPTPSLLHNKSIPNGITTNQMSELSTAGFAPSTTVVTQNSQIIYREMVHNIDGKSFVPGLPAVLSGHDNVSNVAQSSSMYQNVMVLDQFGNTSCMYATPQPTCVPKSQTPLYQNIPTTIDKNVSETNKTLIIEVAPLDNTATVTEEASTSSAPSIRTETVSTNRVEKVTEKFESAGDAPTPNKGLKILSNIKVEVPVQHHKNLLNKVVDLTGAVDRDYPRERRPETPERILPDLDDDIGKNCEMDANPRSMSSVESGMVTNTFSVIKNIGNPPSYKETKGDNMKLQENDSSDSCPVPDLICNEKPSISPCSELSDNGDNAVPHTSISPKLETSHIVNELEIKRESNPAAVRTYRSCPLRLNNIFVKKNKKVLQIKNSKSFPIASTSKTNDESNADETRSLKLPEDFTITRIRQDTPKIEESSKIDKFETVSINKIINDEDDDNDDLDADTEEQSMDIELEPVASSTIDLTQVKEEVNSSHEFSNEVSVDQQYNDMDTLRPISVVQYYNMDENNFDDDSSNKELLDLESASKTKQFVSMMNDNYFGDNIYADYFTPDRVESFNAAREANYSKEGHLSHVWGESSQKEDEFVLPNFSHETYKIAAESSGSGYGLSGECSESRKVESEREYKADMCEGEAPLNICADERMPPRGELSGQESNGDMDAPWTGMYPDVPVSGPYDLMARETWVSDASDVDSHDKRDTGEEDPPKPGALTLHRAKVGRAERGSPAAAAAATAATAAAPALAIKKEEKTDDMLPGMNLSYESKASIATTMLEVYDAMNATQPKIEGAVIKQEPKRRRRDYTCPTCNVDQLTDVAFHQHLKIHPLECLTCGKCFYRRTNLALHIKTHLGIKNYKCTVCEKRFVTRQKLSEHHNSHSGRAPVPCTLCDRTFRRYSNMLQHRDRHHFNKKPKVRDYVCSCGDVYHSRAKLRWHRETHDSRPKSCPHCADKFVHMSSLTRHVRRMHNSYYMRDDLKKNENVPCPICKQIYLKSNLKTHLRTHSGKRPYSCVICNKSFTTQWNLKLHRWTHMSRSAKPYKCNLCKGAFIRQSEYISHMNAHKSVRPYTCNYCGCQFIRKYNCQRHVKEHEMAKKFVCKVPDCGKSFHRSYYLSEHMKVHSGARPFSCNICGKTSSNKSNHNKHVKIHHAREPVAFEA